MDPLIGAGITLGIEVFKFVQQERLVKDLAAKANVSPEQLDAAVAAARERNKALDPANLPEV